jgi:hypothetical protein
MQSARQSALNFKCNIEKPSVHHAHIETNGCRVALGPGSSKLVEIHKPVVACKGIYQETWSTHGYKQYKQEEMENTKLLSKCLAPHIKPILLLANSELRTHHSVTTEITEIVASMRHPRWFVGLGEPRRHFKKFRKDENTTDWYMLSSMNRWNAPILGDTWEIDVLPRSSGPGGVQ